VQQAFFASLPALSYEPETVAHYNRVEAAGGKGIELAYLNAVVKFLKDNKLLDSLVSWWEPSLGYLLSSGQVMRQFSLGGAARDLVPVSSYACPTLTSSGYAGLPELQFNQAVLGTPSFPLGPSQYAIATVLRTTVNTTSTPQSLLGYGPDAASLIGVYNANGKIVCDHVLGYNGTEAGVFHGNSDNYNAQQLRVSMRFLAGRATPAEVIVKSLGVTTTNYSLNSVRGAMTSAQQNKLFTLGATTRYGALERATNVAISCCVVLSTEDATATAALDTFLRTRYLMPA